MYPLLAVLEMSCRVPNHQWDRYILLYACHVVMMWLYHCRSGKPSFKLLYVTPERIAANYTFMEILRGLDQRVLVWNFTVWILLSAEDFFNLSFADKWYYQCLWIGTASKICDRWSTLCKVTHQSVICDDCFRRKQLYAYTLKLILIFISKPVNGDMISVQITVA